MRRILFFFNLIATMSCIASVIIERQITPGYLYLGMFQVITTFIISAVALNNWQYVKELPIYWMLVIGFFVLINIVNVHIVIFLALPMLIALYNCYAYYKFYKLEI